jgi:hypothetical protein
MPLETERNILENELRKFVPVLDFIKNNPNTSITIVGTPNYIFGFMWMKEYALDFKG